MTSIGFYRVRYTSSDFLTPLPQGKFRFETLQKYGPMHTALQTVAKRAGAREDMKITPTQVALNWVVAKGAVPLPGVRNTRDAEEVVGAVGWRLRAEDLELINKSCAFAVEMACQRVPGVVGLDENQEGELRCCEFERIKGGKHFDTSLPWYTEMMSEIGQPIAASSKDAMEH